MQNSADNSFLGNKMPRYSVSNTLHNVDAVDVYKQAEQTRIMPRQIGTGNTRGQQQIYGTQLVRDTNGVVRVVIGYDEGGF